MKHYLPVYQVMDLRCKIAHEQRSVATVPSVSRMWDQRWWQALRGWVRCWSILARRQI